MHVLVCCGHVRNGMLHVTQTSFGSFASADMWHAASNFKLNCFNWSEWTPQQLLANCFHTLMSRFTILSSNGFIKTKRFLMSIAWRWASLLMNLMKCICRSKAGLSCIIYYVTSANWESNMSSVRWIQCLSNLINHRWYTWFELQTCRSGPRFAYLL